MAHPRRDAIVLTGDIADKASADIDSVAKVGGDTLEP